MTDSTPLNPSTQAASSAAMAVKNCVNQVYWDWGNMCPASAETIAAAALRAAADQCAEGATHWALYAIADELENH